MPGMERIRLLTGLRICTYRQRLRVCRFRQGLRICTYRQRLRVCRFRQWLRTCAYRQRLRVYGSLRRQNCDRSFMYTTYGQIP